MEWVGTCGPKQEHIMTTAQKGICILMKGYGSIYVFMHEYVLRANM